MQQVIDLFPSSTTIDHTGQLTFGPHPATKLARQFGTPLYIYDVAVIRNQIAAYRRGLAGYPGQNRLTYASKAFLCPALARLLAEADVGLDVASGGEIFIAQQGGANPASMHLHGNNKSRFDLEQALTAGVGQIVVDNDDELTLLEQMTAAHQTSVKLWLRVTPNVAVATHHRYTVTGAADSKFGFSAPQAKQAAARILAAASTSRLQLTGLHMHLGSHFYDARPVAAALEILLDIAQALREEYGWHMAELCPGGGWGVPYHPIDPPMPIEPFVSGVAAAVEQGCQTRSLPHPTLVLEPGRSLVAPAGVALYKVGGRKEIVGVRTYVSIDGGLADNPRPALYQAQYTALLANKAAAPAVETVAIAGPYCESGDVLIEAVDLPPAASGDLLAVPVAGAYHLSMSSNYNAARRPAVLFIEGDQIKLVQRRETLEDLVRRDLV